MNRLADSTSPYLLQHKDNPVDWWPWSDLAFAEARRRDVPVLLSVGYAACHWCHVMAHESFEDHDIADFLNAHYVPVKVDREERPDVDAVYMDATVALSGHGGWPMTVMCTPDGAPFFAGTYYPPAAFRQLLERASEIWRGRRQDVLAQGSAVREALSRPRTASAGGEIDLAAAPAALLDSLDPREGGFGSAPKFPPSMCLEFLLRHAAAVPAATAALDAVALTCERMSRGGMYDQLAGGFARYSVDAHWVVPHFEKMLYDNALALRMFTHLWRQTGAERARSVALETAGWMLAELRTPQGGFASSLDADSEGHEGRYYVWTPDQLAGVLGPDRGAEAAEIFGVTREGTFEGGSSVLQLRADPADPVAFAQLRSELAAARALRPAPARDDKVVAAWNGLAVAGLAEAALLLDRVDLIDAARECAELLVAVHLRDGRLWRTSRDGVAGPSMGVLEDYGDVAEGWLALHQATGEVRWLTLAGELLEVALTRFGADDGGFYDAADDAEPLLRRPRDPEDNATPSGASATAGALLTYAALTGSTRHREAARAALGSVAPVIAAHPRFAGWSCAVAQAAEAGPLQVAVVDRADLARVARWCCSPGAVVVTRGVSPLLEGRPRGAAYVCRDFACDLPATDEARLREQLGLPPGGTP